MILPGLNSWADKNKDKPEAHAAVVELQGMFKEYEGVRKSTEGADKRIADINTEIGHNSKSIDADLSALSQPNVDKLNTALNTGKNAAVAADASTSGVDATKVDTTKVDTTKVDTTKVDTTKVDATKVDATKVDATKVDATKVDATKTPPPTTTAVTTDAVVAKHGGLRPMHTVAGGDSLAKIAADYSKAYGRNISWNDIYAANKTRLDPPFQRGGVTYVMIYAGQDLSIPGVQDTIDNEVKKSGNG